MAAGCLLLALYPLLGFTAAFFIGWKMLPLVDAVLGIVWSINLYNFMGNGSNL